MVRVMKRPKSHEIDSKAQQVFRSALPPAWVVRDQNPDYGIDYLVEVAESERMTGVTLAVQLKGTTSLKRQGDRIAYRIQTGHLA